MKLRRRVIPSLAEFLQGLGEDASASADAGTMLTVTEDCNVRASADSEGEVIGGFSAGTEVEKKGQEGDWIQVDYDGQCFRSYFNVTTPG